MKKTLLATLLVGALGLGYALGQTVPVPVVPHVNNTDLFQDVVNGVPTAQSFYATGFQITANEGYKDLGTITTDPAYTVTGGIVNIFGHATGTITVVTITMPANPGDGRRVCYWADQTTTSLVFTANTGQTMDANILTAGVAKQSACVTYNATTAVWKSSN